MEYAEGMAIALSLPDVVESTHYGGLAPKRNGRAFLGEGHEPGDCAVKLDWDTHDRLLHEKPHIYFKTPHYEGSPWLLARLDALDRVEARALLQAAWNDAPNPARRRKPSAT